MTGNLNKQDLPFYFKRNGRSLKSRLGKPNRSSSSPAKRYSFWDNDKYEKRTTGKKYFFQTNLS